MDKKELEIQFRNDIELIALNLIHHFGLNYTAHENIRNEPLIRWLDFRLRYITPQPRKVFCSNKFSKKFPKHIDMPLVHLKNIFLKGEDINPYQGEGLFLHHDTNRAKKKNRTDLLWADWNIHHLHVTNIVPEEKYFANRSDWLLFCIVTDHSVGLIDFRAHKGCDFADRKLLETVCHNWPDFMEQYRMQGIISKAYPYSSEEIKKLRKAGIDSLITINNEVYIGPGLGVTSASTSTRVSLTKNNCFSYLSELARIIVDPKHSFLNYLPPLNVINPKLKISLTPKGIALYESTSKSAWTLPRMNSGQVGFLAQLGELHDAIVPEWALSSFFKKWNENFVRGKNILTI